MVWASWSCGQTPMGASLRRSPLTDLRWVFAPEGERLRPNESRPTRPLKQLLQEARVLPWLRPLVPVLRSDDAIVAVADQWVDAAAPGRPGYRVEWRDGPNLTGE